jgi:hypothetical protein
MGVTEVMGSTPVLVELLHEAEDGVELTLQMGNFIIRHGNAREPRDTPHGRLINRHGKPSKHSWCRGYNTGFA